MATPTTVLAFGPFALDEHSRELRRDGAIVPLRPRPFELLRVLANHAGTAISKDKLLELAWPGVVVEENNLQVQISVLRRLLGPEAIATVPRHGYRFVPEVRRSHLQDPGKAPPQREVTAGDPLIGREDDLAVTKDRLLRHRLVTLTGPGGIGKTRLARAALAQCASLGTPLWVDLAALSDEASLASHVLASVPGSSPQSDALAGLRESLARQDWLVVLDNAEHMVDAVSHLLSDLLPRASGVHFLVTSQRPLHLAAEQVVRIGSLPCPPADVDVERARSYGAVSLFTARASAVDRRFNLTRETLPTVLEICRRLDGVPLALELAAARVPSFGLAGLASRLDERFQLLKASTRDAPARHRTLEAVFDWSYQLLQPAEQAVFRRLGVFRASFSLEEAGSQALDRRAEGHVGDEWLVFDCIAALVERSVLTMSDEDPPRYSLSETGRSYALSQLCANSEWIFLQRAISSLEAAGDQASEAASGADALNNFTAALELLKLLPDDTQRNDRELEIGLKLGPALQSTLGPTHPRCEAVYRRCVELARASGPGERSYKALWGYWQFLTLVGRDTEAASFAGQILAMAPGLKDDGFELEALHAAMTTQDLLGNTPMVIEYSRRITSMYDCTRHHRLTFAFGGHDPGVCALGQGAVNLWLTGHPAKAREAAAQACDLAARLQHGYSSASAYYYACITHAALRDTDALESASQSLVGLSGEHGVEMLLTEGRIFQARARYERGHHESINAMNDSLRAVELSRDLGFALIYFALLAEALLASGRAEEAAAVLARGIGHSAMGQALWLPELHRLRGEALLALGRGAEAMSALAQARQIAEAQGALSLQLRAAFSAASHGGEEEHRDLASILARMPGDGSSPEIEAARKLVGGFSNRSGEFRKA